MQEKEEVIENTDKDNTENPINNYEGDGKFHKVRRKSNFTPKKKKRK